MTTGQASVLGDVGALTAGAATAVTSAGAPARRRLRARRPRWERWGERGIEGVVYLCGISAVIFVFGIFFFVFREGAPLLFAGFDLWEFFTSPDWYPTSVVNVRFGAAALILGTLSVTVMAMAMAIPLGLGAAIYVSEFCTGRLKETLKVVIELLAAIPSVVWGFIGLSVMNPLIQQVFNVPVGLNAFNGAVLIALMALPIMVSISEDALKAVPDSFREAAVAMGATRWQTIWRVLVPAAKNGLLAAVLLGVGRAVGETMGALMATGHAINIPTSLFDPVRTLTATIAAELGEASAGSPHYRVLFLVGVLLFGMTFLVNLIADLVIRGVRRQ